MQTVEQIAAAIVAREGGFVDDPDDPGGATNHGVTIGTMRGLGLDLDGNGRVDAADVRRLALRLHGCSSACAARPRGLSSQRRASRWRSTSARALWPACG